MLCDPWRKNLLRAAAYGSEPRASASGFKVAVPKTTAAKRKVFFGLCLEEVIGFGIKK